MPLGFLRSEAMPSSKILGGCESAFLLEIQSMAVVKMKIIKNVRSEGSLYEPINLGAMHMEIEDL